MKNLMKTIDSKLFTIHCRATQALTNNNGMEVIQFLGIALVSIGIAAALATGLTGKLDTTIAAAGSKIEGLFSGKFGS